jgi:FlaA1/EpsC-like NDP-sugar epimerase
MLIIVAGILTGVLDSFSRAVLFLDWLLTVFLTATIRVGIRVLGEARSRGDARGNQSSRRVLVAGAGEAGALVVREMHRNPGLGLQPIGFLDDDAIKQGKRIYGVPVLGRLRNLAAVVRSHKADEVIVAMPRTEGTVVRGVVERARAAGVPARMIPGMFELIGGNVSVSRLREVEISDLLRRAPAEGPRSYHGYLRGRILVTGAGGSIGYELCRQVASCDPELLLLLGHGENSIFEAHANLRQAFPHITIVPVIADIRDRERMHRVMARFRPSTVLHAAAHKHVPLMENNPVEAITNNVGGTRIVVDAAVAAGVQRLILISTDKAVAPASLMGAAKRLGEHIVREAAGRHGLPFAAVRFGNVLGSRGSVVPILKQQIANGGPITLTDPNMRRYFMTIPEAVHLVLQAGGLARGGELFALNMGEPVRIVDLAQDLIRLSGLGVDEIPITFTGMRPGEKLEEVLWESNATVEPTEHAEILRIEEPPIQINPDSIDRLMTTAALDDRLELESLLAELIPTFLPPSAPRASEIKI